MTFNSKTITQFTLIFSLLFSAYSCQKVIDIPIEETGQKVVIEASTSNLLGDSYVLLSRTIDLYGPSIFEKVNNGTVKIKDKNGTEVSFIEDGTNTGRYTHPTFVVTPNNEYTLSVIIDDTEYSAISSTQSQVLINEAYAFKDINFNPAIKTDSAYYLSAAYSDNADEINYYRIISYTNGERTSENLFDDKILNGQTVDGIIDVQRDTALTVIIEMINMDKANFNYFYSLANASDGGPFSATPANPVTNISNGALGYFGAYLKDTVNLILP